MITFRFITDHDIPLLHRWLNTGQVLDKYYYGKSTSLEEVTKEYSKATSDPKTDNYLILNDSTPIGYIQTYLIRVYPEYFALLDIEGNPATFDIFIADEFQRHGFGPLALKEFISTVIFANPAIENIVIAPLETNQKAIKVYEKLGFKFLKKMENPEEPAAEYLMELIRIDFLN